MLRLPQIRYLAIAAMPMLAILVAGSDLAHSQSSQDWMVSEAVEDVLVEHADSSASTAAVGDRLAVGSTITTSANGRAVLSRGDSSMTVSSNSEITLVSEASDTSRTTIRQKIGAILYKVEKQSDQHFEVETPYIVAVVKGTSFSVNVTDGATMTHVVEGAVEVTSLGSRETQLVHPGQTATVSSANDMRIEMSHISNGTGEQAHTPSPAATDTASANRVINRTLGATDLDLAAVTDGLIRSKSGRDDAARSDGSDDDFENDGEIEGGDDGRDGDDVGEGESELGGDDNVAGLDVDLDSDDSFSGIDIDDGMSGIDVDVPDNAVPEIDIDDDDD